MIIIYVGGVGSGKTLSIIKEIVSRKNPCYANFDIANPQVTRLKWEHLLEEKAEEKKSVMKVNYGFWNEQIKRFPDGFDIYLDEFHNLMGSRRAMSKRNVLLSDWMSQIRKILGENELCNLYLVTQKLRRIDINSRDLAHWIVKCEKQVFQKNLIDTVVQDKKGKQIIKKLPLVLIYKYFFESVEACNAFEIVGERTYSSCTRFIGNMFYRYYDSYKMVEMGSEEYL